MTTTTMTFDPPPTSEHPAHNGRRFPSFSSSRQAAPPAYATTEDVSAAKFHKSSKVLGALRIATASVTLIISIPIVACAGNSLKTYSSINLGGDLLLPLWPASVDLRPTHSVLAAGIIVMIASLIYLIAAFFPTPRPKLHLLNITSTALASTCLFVTMLTAIFASTINSHLSEDTSAGTLMTWTCKWQDYAHNAPLHFDKICNETMVSLDLVILLIIIEIFAIATTLWGWWIGSKINRQEAERQGSELKMNTLSSSA